MKQPLSVTARLRDHHAQELEALSGRLGITFTEAEANASPLIDEGFIVAIDLVLPHRGAERLSLLFHTLEEAADFLIRHPDPAAEYPALVKEYGAMLAAGRLVAFPTETVYGLGADATNEEAVRSIFTAKERPLFDPLIVHVARIEQLEGVVEKIDERTRSLIDHFWPGPLTLVVPKGGAIPPIVTSSGPTVAIRMPDNPLALSLIEESGRPIAAPSANRFGYTSPTTARHVETQLGSRIGGLLDGGSCAVGIESTDRKSVV